MANVISIASKPAEGAFAAPELEKPKPPAAPPDGLLVTDGAVAQIRVAMAKQGLSPEEGAALRLGVKGGGCSGMSYSMSFDTKQRDSDRVFEFGGEFGAVRVFIDPKSFVYLRGMTLDYEATLIRQGFNFINPNSTKSCGCGSSFSV
jgi:iron-sulfur cluster assembly protein